MTFDIRRIKYSWLTFVVLTLVGANSANAQGFGNSPYSILGVGDLQSTAFSMNEGTGGAGVSAGNIMQINGLNPALLVRNRYTAFEFAGTMQYKDLTAAGGSQQDLAANLSHIALSFPITAKWSSGVSLKPHSYVDYNTNSSSLVAGTNYPSVYSFSGKGAINRVAWTNGFAIGKYINVGFDLFYLFGNIEKSSQVTLVTGSEDNSVGVKEKLNLKNVSGRGGASFRLPVKKDKMYVNVGGTYTYGNFLYAKRSAVYELSRDSFTDTSYRPDTLQKGVKGYVDMPSQYRIGASFELPFKLLVSADYEYTDWDAFKSFGSVESNQVASTGRVYLGVDYIPKFNRSLRYLDQVSYRAGANFGPSYYAPNGNQINETSFSLGLGLPIGRGGASALSLAFTGGERGVVSANTLRERFYRMTVAWAFADRWFEKPRLD
jgi:hypothetical protein